MHHQAPVLGDILIYGDSLSWGIIPGTRKRLPIDKRWPGILSLAQGKKGHSPRFIEDCLNGRRTRWEDRMKLGRNASMTIAQAVEAHSPLSLVIICLGTNDFQVDCAANARESAVGLERVINAIQTAPIEPGMPRPSILVVAPPPIGNPLGAMSQKFFDAALRSEGLAAKYHRVAVQCSADFFDAGSVASASEIDGVHIDEIGHQAIANALTDKIADIFDHPDASQRADCVPAPVKNWP